MVQNRWENGRPVYLLICILGASVFAFISFKPSSCFLVSQVFVARKKRYHQHSRRGNGHQQSKLGGESDWRVYEAHDPLVGAHAQSSVNLPKTANKLNSPGMGVVPGQGQPNTVH